MAMTEVPSPPVIGLLTRTLVDSPVIKLIIPARIRHVSRNDVVFVRERSVEIKELCNHGSEGESSYLREIAIKNDFDSPIRAARIFGMPRSFEKLQSGIEAIVKRESTPMSCEDIVPRPQLPPQILVLTLESMKLVFLFAFHDENGHVRFQSSYRNLASIGRSSRSQQLGEHIAVDPRSRAMAVAANEGSFYFYTLKHREVITDEMNAAHALQDFTLNLISGVSPCE